MRWRRPNDERPAQLVSLSWRATRHKRRRERDISIGDVQHDSVSLLRDEDVSAFDGRISENSGSSRQRREQHLPDVKFAGPHRRRARAQVEAPHPEKAALRPNFPNTNSSLAGNTEMACLRKPLARRGRTPYIDFIGDGIPPRTAVPRLMMPTKIRSQHVERVWWERNFSQSGERSPVRPHPP
jgi:hypothetical protein